MNRTYHYHGFDIEVAVEADSSWQAERSALSSVGYVAVVRICKTGDALAFSPRCVLANREDRHFSAKPM